MTLSRERLMRLAEKAGIRLIFDSKFGRSDYDSITAPWPALEAFALETRVRR